VSGPQSSARTAWKWEVKSGDSRGHGPPGTAANSLFFQADALETLVEAGKLAAAVDEALLAAGPGRMGFRIDFEMERVARLAIVPSVITTVIS
jgi:hypothetical protein